MPKKKSGQVATGGKAPTVAQRAELLDTLEARFEAHPHRHDGLEWHNVLARLERNDAGLRALHEMERTGGEPDVIGREGKAGAIVFCDCSPESPTGRRSLCYDREALEARKAHPPKGDAMSLAEAMGVELLTEAQYRELQRLGEFDLKTSSWVQTPADIRMLGGALFCDRRYDHVFLYHNGAQSYYAARGFRGTVTI